MLSKQRISAYVVRVIILGAMALICRSAGTELSPAPTEAPITPVPSPHRPTPQPSDTPTVATPKSPVVRQGEGFDLTVLCSSQVSPSPKAPVAGADLRSCRGFSAWLEYDGQVVLFDAGSDWTAMLRNLAALDLATDTVDVVVLSTTQDSDAAGLGSFLAENPRIVVYVPLASPDHLKREILASRAALVEVSGSLEILPGLWSTGQIGREFVEQALVARTVRGSVVVIGCADSGADLIADRAKLMAGEEIALVTGGYHHADASQERPEQFSAELGRLGVREVALCQCRWDEVRTPMRENSADVAHECGVGWQWHDEAQMWRFVNEGIPAQVGVAAVAVAPSDPQVIYLAAYELGGLYRSDDGGESWRAGAAGMGRVTSLALTVHPTEADVAWTTTLSGAYRTTDGARSWQLMTGLPQGPLYALAIDRDGQTLYAGGEEPGIWRSDDGGQTWSSQCSPCPEASTLSLLAASDGLVLAGTGGKGLWWSQDRGQSWRMAGGELAGARVAALAASDDGQLFALANGQLYTGSSANGAWRPIGAEGFGALCFALAGGTSSRLYLGGRGEGLALSADGGNSWVRVGGEFRHADITWLTTDPVDPDRVYLGTRYHGLYRSGDAGVSWDLVSEELGLRAISALVQDPIDSRVFFAGALDGIYCTEDGGKHWHLVSSEVGKVFVQSLAMDPSSRRIYAGTRHGVYVSEDNGTTWQWRETDTGGIAVFDVLVDPHDTDRVYAGSWGNNVLLSSDAGATWSPIHQGLETLSAHCVAVNPANPQSLYVGTVETIYRSINGGESWEMSALSERPLSVFDLIMEDENPDRLYAGTTEGVYGSYDGGEVWVPLGRMNLTATVAVLAQDSADLSIIYAGTERQGLYRSLDGGRHWHSWGLKGASVYAMVLDSSGQMWLGTDKGVTKNR